MPNLSMVPLLINSARIKYAVLDNLFSKVNIPNSEINFYMDGYYVFHKLYKSDYLVDIYKTDIDQFIKDAVVAVLNTVAHYRRYFATRMHKSNRIFIVFNRKKPSYQSILIKDYGRRYYEKLYPTHFQYGAINMIIEQALGLLENICQYIDDVFIVDNRKVEDHVAVAFLEKQYVTGFNIYYTRNELMSVNLDNKSMILYPKRDESYLLTVENYFQNFFGKVKYKPTFMTAEYAAYYFALSGVKSKSIPGTCVNGAVKGAKIIDSMIEDDTIDIHTSVNGFVYMLPKYLGRELTAEETKSVTSLYKAINIRANLAAMSSASKTRMLNSLVNLYDQTGLEELNNMLDSDDVLNLTDLNMNKVKIPKSYWNWDDTDWGQF